MSEGLKNGRYRDGYGQHCEITGMNLQSKLWKPIPQQSYGEPIPPGAGELSAAN